MNCLKCKGKTLVVDTRALKVGMRRRRECSRCGDRFTTYEEPAPPEGTTTRTRATLTEQIKYLQQRLRWTKRGHVWKLRQAARDEAAETGEPVETVYERWGCA